MYFFFLGHFHQVLEEARKHNKRETTRSNINNNAAIDMIHFKLQKPISRDESSKKIKKNNKRLRWWKNALHFFKWKLASSPSNNHHLALEQNHHQEQVSAGVRWSALSGPIYVTESRSSGCSTPYNNRITTNRGGPTSGPLAGNLSPAQRDEIQIPYICLRDVNEMDHHQQQFHNQQRMSTSSSAPMAPIYLVT